MKWWHWHCFGAEALARQGAWDAAIAYAEGCRSPQGYNDRQIDRFCEDVLIESGRADDAYSRFGLRTATGPTYLAIYRETAKRYPDRDRRQVLLDLIEMRGERGKWFAAAKEAGLFDIALLCARDVAAEPATSYGPPGILLRRSRNSRRRSEWRRWSAYSAAVAMIRKFR